MYFGGIMFNIEQFPSVLLHFKSISKIFRKNSSGWYEIFCPYCDDAVRKANPNHGHGHVAPDFPFVHCFRCGFHGNLNKVLIDTGFKDTDVLKEIAKYNSIVYNASKKIHVNTLSNNDSLHIKIKDHYNQFMKTNPVDFNIFKHYIMNRCYEIDPTKFFIIPTYISNKLAAQFLNFNGKIVTSRFISNSDTRYFIPNEKHFYYFQNLGNIIDFQNIVLCEGSFDLINLYSYSPLFKNSFFISIGGSNYKNCISTIISNFLLIGKYTINVVFDKNVNDMNSIINHIAVTSVLNPKIDFKYYTPTLYKDVSDCIYLDQF